MPRRRRSSRRDGAISPKVLTLNRLARRCARHVLKTGPSASTAREVKFQLDEAGKPIGVYFKEQKESNQMIEEFMLLANRRVAEFCGKRKTDKGAHRGTHDGLPRA